MLEVLAFKMSEMALPLEGVGMLEDAFSGIYRAPGMVFFEFVCCSQQD